MKVAVSSSSDSLSRSRSKKPKRIGIIGVGNSLMGDDGVGIAVLALLKNETLPENVFIIDIGMSSLNLLHALTELDAAIIVDAVDFGGSPGEKRCFSPENIKSIKRSSGQSTHEYDLLNMIELSNKLGECPETVIIFAIQPANLFPSMELSSTLKMILPNLVKDILEIIRHVA
ncbi:MAG: hydrogenase maturation protease [Actinomycetota bacterium]|nr:hydrogenase maturation protease [Actinomycetota bacterium]